MARETHGLERRATERKRFARTLTGMMLTPMIAAISLQAVQVLSGPWQYSARNQEGKVIASGMISFAQNKPKGYGSLRTMANWTYYGTRMTTCVDPSKYGPHANRIGKTVAAPPSTLGVGQLAGANLVVDKFDADLNVGMFDNNIRLDGTFTGKKIEGTWYWATYAGARVKGTFTLTRFPPKRVH